MNPIGHYRISADMASHDWKEIQNLIFENLYESIPEEVEHIKKEVTKILEEKKKNVCETDKRNDA